MESPVPALAAEGSQWHSAEGGVQRGVVWQVQLVVRVIRCSIRIKEMSGTCQHRQRPCNANQAQTVGMWTVGASRYLCDGLHKFVLFTWQYYGDWIGRGRHM